MLKQFFLILFFTLPIIAISQEKYTSERYRIQLDVPEGSKYQTETKGEFGALLSYEQFSHTYMEAYAHLGTIEKDKIFDLAEHETGIPHEDWKLVESGDYHNGFQDWEMYFSKHYKNVLYTMIGKNASHDIHYLIILMAPVKYLQENNSHYMEWLEDVVALN